jgi:hypothetical protein
VGEEARYAAYWSNAGVNVAAGEIMLRVDGPPYVLAGTLQTADWMDQFFDVRGTFRTETDEALVPRLHERDERQGSRRVVRAFVYQHDEGLLRIGSTREDALGGDAVTLPLAPSARDAISAIFYARTLPLAPGDRYRIPVNEAGRSVVAEVTVGAREPVTAGGRQVAAIRTDVRLRRRAERRRPTTATLWFSDDSRRLPVALDLDAPFGRVRVELVSYNLLY